MKFLIAIAALVCAGLAWAAPPWVRATVVRVDPERARVVLDHERIARINMDAMVMPFKVDKAVALAGFKPGDKVRFTFVERDDHLVIDALERRP
ncbi:MAG TPA: RND transporter [Curvibacter sp.]|nr:RND transporter [Curvibacter sp.]